MNKIKQLYLKTKFNNSTIEFTKSPSEETRYLVDIENDITYCYEYWISLYCVDVEDIPLIIEFLQCEGMRFRQRNQRMIDLYDPVHNMRLY